MLHVQDDPIANLVGKFRAESRLYTDALGIQCLLANMQQGPPTFFLFALTDIKGTSSHIKPSTLNFQCDKEASTLGVAPQAGC